MAVLRAVDDLLVEEGYAAMTMKGIAARAGVGKQTVYRWWTSKAEILLEAVMQDAREELVIEPEATTPRDFARFIEAVRLFLTESHAGIAYRALVGEAQHDQRVAELLRGSDALVVAARPVLQRAIARGDLSREVDLANAAADLLGPVFFGVFTGSAAAHPAPRPHTRRR
jgi:AcrR family transcriptional regulator